MTVFFGTNINLKNILTGRKINKGDIEFLLPLEKIQQQTNTQNEVRIKEKKNPNSRKG
jgi:hypothetical protein